MAVKQLMTAEDLLAMPEVPGKRLELFDGELIELPGSTAIHNFISAVLYRLVFAFVEAHDLGVVATDGASFIIDRDPDVVRIPDVSFVSWDRIPGRKLPRGYWPFPPDLAVEVVSPIDSAVEVRRKVNRYLQAGTRLVWLVWPDDRVITVYVGGTAPRDLYEGDELDGGDVLPGFRAPVSQVFDIPIEE